MNVPVEVPQQTTALVGDDGRLTRDGIVIFQRLVEAIQDLQARVDALEAFHP